jgi:hypothetical protein
MEIYNLETPAYCEAMGLSKVWKAYADNCTREDIMQVGFNENSGYVYIALGNGVTIGSCMGAKVQYIVSGDEEEFFFPSYRKATEFLEKERGEL